MGRVGSSGLNLETGDVVSYEEGMKLAAELRKLKRLKEEGDGYITRFKVCFVKLRAGGGFNIC